MLSRKNLLTSFVDQVFVSGGSFLTIVIGAHLLELNDQGKLGYVVTAYMVTILLNVALFIYAAPLVSFSTPHLDYYRSSLRMAQTAWAMLLAAIIAAAFSLYGGMIGWEVSGQEAGLLWLFLAAQQIADYRRRANYVFRNAAAACKVSMVTYGLRIGLLLLVRPDDISGVLVVLIVAALVSATPLLVRIPFARTEKLAPAEAKALLGEHAQLSRWAIFQALLGWVSYSMPVFVLGFYYSAESVAILIGIRSIASAANVLLELLETIVPVRFAHIAGKMGREELRFSTGRLLFIGGVLWFLGVLLILVFGGLAIKLILGEKFEPYSFILMIAWYCNGIYFVSRVAGLYWRAQKNAKAEFFGSVGGFLLFLGCVPVIAKYGLEGAAWGYVIIPIGVIAGQYLYARLRRVVA